MFALYSSVISTLVNTRLYILRSDNENLKDVRDVLERPIFLTTYWLLDSIIARELYVILVSLMLFKYMFHVPFSPIVHAK